MHRGTNVAVEALTLVLVQAEDFWTAFQIASKCMAVNVQLQGLDGLDVFQSHLTMANVYNRLQTNGFALQHLLAAKYILTLSCGPRHPELISLFLRLALIYGEMLQFPVALRCLEEALVLAEFGDQVVIAHINQNIGNILTNMGDFQGAARAHYSSYAVLIQLFGEANETVMDAKLLYESTFRRLTEHNVARAKAKQAAEAAERERELADGWLDDAAPAGGDHNKKKSGSKSKSKNGKKK